MSTINKKNLSLLAGMAVMLVPAISFAADSVDTASGNTATSATTAMAPTLSLQGRIDGNYKTVFHWNKLDGNIGSDIVQSYILLLSYTGEPSYPNNNGEQVFTVDSNKTDTVDWHAKNGSNYYKLCAITQNNATYCSQVVKIVMDGNGRPVYDVNYKPPMNPSGSGMTTMMPPPPPYGSGMMASYPYGSGTFRGDMNTLRQNYQGQMQGIRQERQDDVNRIRQENSGAVNGMRQDMQSMKPMLTNLTADQKTKLDYLRTSLEAELKTLRESITKDNITDVKTKADALKTTYLAKAAEIAPNTPELQKIIEERFAIFAQNQFTTRENMQWARQDMQNQMGQVKNAFTQAKQDLVAQYKQKFITALAGKLDSIPTDKLQAVLDKVTTKREETANNAKLTSTSKEKLLAQFDALISILNDKLGITPSDEVNVNDLIQ